VTYAWIHQHRDSFPVVLLCEVFAVSKSGYYASIDRPVSPRARRHERIQAAVSQVHARSHGIYGSLKISQALAQQDELELACRNTVATAMRELVVCQS
jgi:putative transposase